MDDDTRLLSRSTGGGEAVWEGQEDQAQCWLQTGSASLRHIQELSSWWLPYVLEPLAETGGTDWVIVIETQSWVTPGGEGGGVLARSHSVIIQLSATL